MSIEKRWMQGLAGLLVVGLAACGGDAQADGTAEAEAEPSTGFVRVINVETVTVEPMAFTELIRLTGTVMADQDVIVAAEESGIIRELYVDKGTWVRADQAIAKIDDRVLKAQVDQARANADLADEVWQRRKTLYEVDQVGSELAYLEAKYAAVQTKASLASLQERLERTVVRSPIRGVLDTRDVEIGTMVQPGVAVGRVVVLNPVKIAAGVPERYAADVQRGAKVSVSFDVLRQTFDGELTYVGAAVDARSRTFPVEFRIPNPEGTIKPEMVANIGLVRATIDDAIVVPEEALVRVEQGFVAFVVTGAGGEQRVESRVVTRGPAQQNTVVVEEGLTAGDELVVVGQQQVAAGDRVRVVSR